MKSLIAIYEVIGGASMITGLAGTSLLAKGYGLSASGGSSQNIGALVVTGIIMLAISGLIFLAKHNKPATLPVPESWLDYQ